MTEQGIESSMDDMEKFYHDLNLPSPLMTIGMMDMMDKHSNTWTAPAGMRFCLYRDALVCIIRAERRAEDREAEVWQKEMELCERDLQGSDAEAGIRQARAEYDKHIARAETLTRMLEQLNG